MLVLIVNMLQRLYSREKNFVICGENRKPIGVVAWQDRREETGVTGGRALGEIVGRALGKTALLFAHDSGKIVAR